MKLTVATSQFPVCAEIAKNCSYVLRQMRMAKDGGADVAHFCEAGLSGYAGNNITSFKGFDWDLLQACTHRIIQEAQSLRLWVLLGSTHRLTGRHKPHNSVYVINDRGKIVDRYDKMFCSGDRSGKTGDLSYYSPGSHFCVFTVKGVKCGVMICYDYRFSELYREYKRLGTQLMFHSFNAGRV